MTQLTHTQLNSSIRHTSERTVLTVDPIDEKKRNHIATANKHGRRRREPSAQASSSSSALHCHRKKEKKSCGVECKKNVELRRALVECVVRACVPCVFWEIWAIFPSSRTSGFAVKLPCAGLRKPRRPRKVLDFSGLFAEAIALVVLVLIAFRFPLVSPEEREQL